MQFRTNDASGRFEGNLLPRANHLLDKAGETTGPVPAHLRLAPISIVVTHPEVGAVLRRLEQKNSISAHATMAIANPGDLLPLQANLAAQVIQHDEVVAGSIHFDESQHHSSSNIFCGGFQWRGVTLSRSPL